MLDLLHQLDYLRICEAVCRDCWVSPEAATLKIEQFYKEDKVIMWLFVAKIGITLK